MLTVLALALGACGSPAGPPVGPDPSLDGGPADRDRLAGFAAIAKDRRYVATYLLSSPGRSDRTVTAAFGTDGTWVVGIPGGALSGEGG